MKPSAMRAARRAAGSLLPPSEDGGAAGPVGRRRHLHGAAPVLERLAAERGLQRGDDLGHPLGPLVHGHAVHGELLGHVAGGDDEVDAAAAEVVEHDEVLGEAERVVERRDERGDDEAHVLRAGRHRREHRERAREVAVGRAVVLGDGDAHAAQPVGPLGHVEGGRVAVGRRGAGERGVAEVEAEPEEGHAAAARRGAREGPCASRGEAISRRCASRVDWMRQPSS